MLIDKSRLLPLKEAAKLLPGAQSVATLRGWMAVGVGGHKLPSVRIGGRRFIDPEDLYRFFVRTDPNEASPE